MRTLVLVVATLFFLSLGFLAYWWIQPAHQPKGIETGPRTTELPKLKSRDTDKPVGPGRGVWVNRYDLVTGKVASRFRAEDYQPQKDGWVIVGRPQAQFFLKDGRVLAVEGRSGSVIADTKGGQPLGAGSPPSRGRLSLVTVSLYHNVDDPEVALDRSPRPKAAMTVQLNNASFDNETFRIFSESFKDSDGKIVPRDMVPAVVRGEEFNFDGKGLMIKWNDRDGRLALLEVDHGEKLTILRPGTMMRGLDKPQMAEFPAPLPFALASSDPRLAMELLAQASQPARRDPFARPKVQRVAEPPLYRAVFNDDVKIKQGSDLAVDAAKLSVDFLLEEEEKAGPATTQASSQPASRPARRPARPRPPASRATTQGTDQPIEITWTGKLRVEPLSMGAESPMTPGDSVVKIEGAPVKATQQGSTMTCGTLTYRTEDGMVMLTPVSEEQPIVLTDSKGAVVRTRRLDISQPKRTAVLRGDSSAVMPIDDGSGPAGTNMTARWARACTLYFSGETQQSMDIERAELDGDVRIDHPRLKLNSAELDITFAPKPTTRATTGPATAPTTGPTTVATTGPTTGPSTRPASNVQLRQLIATGEVHCTIVDEGNKSQSIGCSRLTLQTRALPDGRLYPSTINADGKVLAVDQDQQQMKAEHLAVTLKPSTRPATTRPSSQSAAAATIESMHAHKDVEVITKDGTRASAESLVLTGGEGGETLKLLGQPATIVEKTTTLSGPIIEISPASQKLDVVGGGTMTTVQQDKPGSPPKPIEITWKRSLSVDGKTNAVECLGDVNATMKEADGAVSVATGQRVRMTLVDAAKSATTRATTQATTLPATKPSNSAYAALSAKAVKNISFTDEAQVSSTTLTEDGKLLLKRLHLESARIDYDMMARVLNIPVPGRMIVEDHTAAATRPADGGAAGPNAKGSTAFKWDKSLTFDDATKLAIMDGGVTIVHSDDASPERVYRLTADTVTAEMESAATTRPATEPATKPTTGPATAQAVPLEQRLSARKVTASGNVYFRSPQGEVTAQSVTYDPQTQWLTARGTDRNPVVTTIASVTAGNSVTCLEFQYNLQTGEGKIIQPIGTLRR